MAWIDSENSTAVPVTSTRRRFLTQAALAAAAGATLGATLPLPEAAGAAQPVADQLYAAIEAHRRARAEYLDDPRWISAEKTTFRAYHAMEDRACDLVDIVPTTIAGVVALMTYVAVVEKDGDGDLAWPDRLDDESDEQRLGKRWSYFLHLNLAVSQQSIIDGGGA